MKHKIVAKTWGMEVWFVNREYCGKRLIFAEDHRCSAHYHKNKHETFLVTHGRLMVEVCYMIGGKPDYDETFIYEVGETIEIPVGAIHRMTAVGGNAAIIEFSTHHEDSDSYRIESGQVWDA